MVSNQEREIAPSNWKIPLIAYIDTNQKSFHRVWTLGANELKTSNMKNKKAKGIKEIWDKQKHNIHV